MRPISAVMSLLSFTTRLRPLCLLVTLQLSSIKRSLNHFTVFDQRANVSCSIGVASSDLSVDTDELISNADVAMYRSKSDGRGYTTFYGPQMRISIEERDALEHSLRSAIEQRSVDVHFQPIIELATGSIRSVETLARWNQPGKGPISPSEFIPVAEESGLIMPLGQLIFETVCQQQVRWRMAHPDNELRSSINVSARELAHSDWLPSIKRILRRPAPRHLVLPSN